MQSLISFGEWDRGGMSDIVTRSKFFVTRIDIYISTQDCFLLAVHAMYIL